MKRHLTLGAYIALVSLPEGLLAQADPAYRLQGNSIRVDRVPHWNNWIYQNDLVTSLNAPVGGVNILEVGAGGLRPVFFRRNVNVAPTATHFTYKDQVRAQGALTQGGTSAKSNAGLAGNVIDGDLTTFWEPDTPADYPSRLDAPGHFHLDGLREWEVEIDLGRLVFADSLTFIFPSDQFEGEFLGQPVKAFGVFASMGERFPFPLGNNLRFTLVAQASTGVVGADGVELVPVPGTEGRYAQMTFGLVPLDRADWDLDGIPDISGTFLQYIRFKATASDLWRDAFLGSGEEARLAYEALPAERRGAVIYQRLTAGGLLVDLRDDGNQTAREKHQTLPEAKRGPILYYVKEVPRLAEVQVWTRGDNYAYQPESRAGDSFEHGGLGAPELATDGNYDTEWQANTWSPVYVKGTAWYDLGAVFWVDNLSVVNKRINQSNHGAFIGPGILVSDGTLLKPVAMEDRGDFTQLEDGLQWHNIIGEEKLTNRTSKVRIFQEDFPLRKIRFLQIRDLDITGVSSGRYGALATLAEFQLFGEGYPVSVWAYSPPIALTDSRGEFVRKTLPRISWEGDIIVRETDPLTGESVERFEPLHSDPDVRLQVQTRTSDQTDSLFTYFEVVSVAGSEERTEVTKDRHDQIALQWAAWEYWQTLPSDQRHASRHDDDGDGLEDEDEIDFKDNDGDGLVDEDGKKLRRAPRSTFARDGELAFVGWSPWSESYLPTNGLSQATVTSPNPRKFIQVRVNILSEDPFKTARIRSLRIDLAPPVALELVGELALLSDDGAGRALTDLGRSAHRLHPPHRHRSPQGPAVLLLHPFRRARSDRARRLRRGADHHAPCLPPHRGPSRPSGGRPQVFHPRPGAGGDRGGGHPLRPRLRPRRRRGLPQRGRSGPGAGGGRRRLRLGPFSLLRQHRPARGGARPHRGAVRVAELPGRHRVHLLRALLRDGGGGLPAGGHRLPGRHRAGGLLHDEGGPGGARGTADPGRGAGPGLHTQRRRRQRRVASELRPPEGAAGAAPGSGVLRPGGPPRRPGKEYGGSPQGRVQHLHLGWP